MACDGFDGTSPLHRKDDHKFPGRRGRTLTVDRLVEPLSGHVDCVSEAAGVLQRRRGRRRARRRGFPFVRLRLRTGAVFCVVRLGETGDLGVQFFADFLIVAVNSAGVFLVAVEPVEHPEEGPDRLEIASGDGLARQLRRGAEAGELQQRMRHPVVDLPLLQNLRDDLPDPRRRQPLLAGDLVIGPALAQSRKNALLPRPLAESRQASRPETCSTRCWRGVIWKKCNSQPMTETRRLIARVPFPGLG